MSRTLSACAILLSVAALAAAQGPAAECRVVAIDGPIVEGEPFTVVARYSVPEGSVRINCELKSAQHVVLSAARREISGTGEMGLRLVAPSASDHRAIILALWLGEDWQNPLAPMVQTQALPVMTAAQAETMKQHADDAPQVLQSLGWEESEAGNVAVLRDDLPGLDAAVVDRYIAALTATGISVTPLAGDHLANPYVLDPERFDMLVLTHPQTFPAEALESIGAYTDGGGDLIAIGAPAFSRQVAKVDGEWMYREEYLARLAGVEPTTMIQSFDTLPDLRRGTNNTESETTAELGAGAGDTNSALHVKIGDLTGWDTHEMTVAEGAFGPGDTLTCFWAKGAERTTQLSMEWRERDGSRWIATIPLTAEWTHHALRPADFRFWQDSSSEGRGGAGDVLNPANAGTMAFGLAFTHTPVPGGEHEYWIDEIGSASNPFSDEIVFESAEVPVIGTVSPPYKIYENADAASLDASAGLPILGESVLPMPLTVLSSHVRPQGTGFGKQRKWRWVPLVQARGAGGEVTGTLATLMLNDAGGSIVSITAGDADYAAQEGVLETVVRLAERLIDGIFLYEGGSEFYAYFGEESVKLGAQVRNGGAQPTGRMTVEFVVNPDDRPFIESFRKRMPVSVAAGDEAVVSTVWESGLRPGREYTVTTTLKRDGQVIGELVHPLIVWKKPSKPQHVTARDGHFFVGDEPWFPHGVNYMPSSECGIEDNEYFEFWLDPQPYDPAVTERDLSRCAAMGFNMVSVFVYHRSIDSRNLLDLLMRCEKHGLRVNLSLRPGTPLAFEWPETGEIIQRYRLAEMDNIFVYDLAWEPVFGNYERRKVHDRAWEDWVVERYRSVANAETDWGVSIPRVDEVVTSPSDEQVATDGDWRAMSIAYRRFLDDLLSKAHLRAAQKIKSVDPNHLISFRMNTAGDPTVGASWIAYDFHGLAKSVDVMEPEGYGRIGDWDRIKPGWFTAAYSRYAAPGRPVMWAEFGRHVWDRNTMSQSPEQLAITAQFYRDFLNMVLRSGADGAVCWFYPGGYRVNELSDYGIINPDGTWREVTEVIHDFADRMTSPRDLPDTQKTFTVDRGADPSGIQGIWAEIGQDFMAAAEAGENPILIDETTDRTSADEPVIAVGNRPYNGANPPKYLNAEFNTLRRA